jgi:hypothetical protein
VKLYVVGSNLNENVTVELLPNVAATALAVGEQVFVVLPFVVGAASVQVIVGPRGLVALTVTTTPAETPETITSWVIFAASIATVPTVVSPPPAEIVTVTGGVRPLTKPVAAALSV